MKNTLKKYIPKSLLIKYRKFQNNRYIRNKKRELINGYQKFYNYDNNRLLNFSNALYKNNKEEKIIAQIIIICHTIEKGLTMKTIKSGFGKDKVRNLIQLCENYIKHYNRNNGMLLEAIGVLVDYNEKHKVLNKPIEQEVQDSIKNLKIKSENISNVEQKKFTLKEYFASSNAAFDEFSTSRCSLRNFDETKTIKTEHLIKVVEIAQNAPSTCNRQSVRLHILTNKNEIIQALSLQNGNRGFGNNTDKLIILTTDIQDWEGGGNLRNGPPLDAGIYTMNLLYALHYNQIGACTLNWYVSIENDIKLRKLAKIPKNENILVFIACGLPPDKFKTTNSKRKSVAKILTIR